LVGSALAFVFVAEALLLGEPINVADYWPAEDDNVSLCMIWLLHHSLSPKKTLII
jgi:hypothetical protein